MHLSIITVAVSVILISNIQYKFFSALLNL